MPVSVFTQLLIPADGDYFIFIKIARYLWEPSFYRIRSRKNLFQIYNEFARVLAILKIELEIIQTSIGV